MRIPSAFLLLWIATMTGASAQAPSIDRVETANPGIYELSIKKIIDDKKLAGHSWHVVTGVRMVQAITTVPARRCISFGFEYVIVGSPANAEVAIRMVTKFPQPGLRNPETFETTYQHEAVVTHTLGHVHFRSYTLESSWELVPGVWTFELWHRDRKLAEQRFTVTHARTVGQRTLQRVHAKRSWPQLRPLVRLPKDERSNGPAPSPQARSAPIERGSVRGPLFTSSG